MYVGRYVRMYVSMHACMNVCIHVHMDICIHACVDVYRCICIYVQYVGTNGEGTSGARLQAQNAEPAAGVAALVPVPLLGWGTRALAQGLSCTKTEAYRTGS